MHAHYPDNGRDQYAQLRAGLIAVSILLVFSVLFYKERMILTDASLLSFRRINLGDLESSQRRYGAYITEIVPLLLAKTGLSLQGILIAYSASFVLFYGFTAWIIGFRWHQPALALAFTLNLFLFCSDAFYWTNIEIHQAVAYGFLAIATLQRFSGWKQPVLFILLSTLAIFTHPLCIAVLGALWLYFILDRRLVRLSRSGKWLYTVALALIAALKLALSLSQGYDGRRLSGITQVSAKTFFDLSGSGFLPAFFIQAFRNYWLASGLFVAAVVMWGRQRKWLLIAWLICAVAAVLFAVGAAFGIGAYHYYLEGEWQILGMVIALPAVYHLFPALKAKSSLALVAGILCVRLIYIGAASSFFTKRVAYIQQLVDKMRDRNITKAVLVATGDCPEKRSLYTWSLATETMTLSALDGEYPQRTMAALYPDQLSQLPGSKDSMRVNFDNIHALRLNERYFALDTDTYYIRIGCDTFTAGF